MNKLFDLHLTEEELREIGVTLGADVPYCIAGGTMISEGIGEVLTELPDIPDLTFLIAKPVFGISTKEAYGDFDAIPEEDIVHPDIDGMAEAIRNSDICGIVDRLGNVLEDASIPKHQEIEEIKNIMKENGALNALMSGSGPTVFGIFTDETVDEGTGNGETLSGKEKAWRTVQILQEKEYISDLFTVGAVKKSDIDK
jgi:4-diphosphocytidyl-2-C-methyl-D-erythritol kinase